MGTIFMVLGTLLILAVPVLIIMILVRFFRKKELKKLFHILIFCFVAGNILGVTGSFIDNLHNGEETESAQEVTDDIVKESEGQEEVLREDEEISYDLQEDIDSEVNNSEEDSFLTTLKSQMDETVASEAYRILKDEIGFSELDFVEKIGDTTNYKINADGTEILLTASDKVYRIFIPNSDNVFYEDDAVKITAKQYEDTQIGYDEQSAYYIIAKTIVESALKNPGSAKFPSINTEAGSIAIERNGALVVVQSYVDAKNSFNAMARSSWTVEFMVYDLNTYSYDTLYIEIDGEKSGEYIKLDDWVQP
jgi:hypothetical protein